MFLNLIGNIFASREANFVSATMFPRVGKQGNFEETSRVTNVSATMFPSLPWALGMQARHREKLAWSMEDPTGAHSHQATPPIADPFITTEVLSSAQIVITKQRSVEHGIAR